MSRTFWGRSRIGFQLQSFQNVCLEQKSSWNIFFERKDPAATASVSFHRRWRYHPKVLSPDLLCIRHHWFRFFRQAHLVFRLSFCAGWLETSELGRGQFLTKKKLCWNQIDCYDCITAIVAAALSHPEVSVALPLQLHFVDKYFLTLRLSLEVFCSLHSAQRWSLMNQNN